MAVCSNCGSNGPRVRSRWTEKGEQLPDECPQCAPGSFEKFTSPSDKKIWMGYEAHPNEYEKQYDNDGVMYIRKPEYRAEQEARLSLLATDETEAEERAMAQKREERRTAPMDATELLQAIGKARMIGDALLEASQTASEESQEAERLAWTAPPTLPA